MFFYIPAKVAINLQKQNPRGSMTAGFPFLVRMAIRNQSKNLHKQLVDKIRMTDL